MHEIILDAAWNICVPTRMKGRNVTTMCNAIPTPDWPANETNFESWRRYIGESTWNKLRPTTRIMVPICAEAHFSLIEIDLPNKKVQHHDSLGCHAADTRWVKTARWLGGRTMQEVCERHHAAERATEIRALQPIASLHTQRPASNNCIIHTLHYIMSLTFTERVTPLRDTDATNERTRWAQRLEAKMQYEREM